MWPLPCFIAEETEGLGVWWGLPGQEWTGQVLTQASLWSLTRGS